MEQFETHSQSAQNSSVMIRLIHSVQAPIPAMGSPAADLNTSAEQSSADTDTPAKQTAASAVPALGNSKDTLKKTELLDPKSVSVIFKIITILHFFCGFSIVDAIKTTITTADEEIMRMQFLSKVRKASKGTNPNRITKNRAYKINCVNCSLIFAKRMAEQPYIAHGRESVNDHLADGRIFFRDMFDPPIDINKISVIAPKEIQMQRIADSVSHWKPGDVAFLAFYYKDKKGEEGHAMNVAVGPGELICYVDSQIDSVLCNKWMYIERIDFDRPITFVRISDKVTTDELKNAGYLRKEQMDSIFLELGF